MQWTDNAIVLSIRRLGEHSGVVHLLTRERGVHAGVDKAAFGKRRQGVYQPGNVVEAHWQARLVEHIGTLTAELVDPVASRLLDSRPKLAVLTSAVQMVERVLPERDPHPEIYERVQYLLGALCTGTQPEWLCAYVLLEYELLVCAGFGLDLSACAATGQQHDLTYISPRTGRAVSREAGLPYHDKLFALPEFLVGETALLPDVAQLAEGLKICGYFLNERVFVSRNLRMPEARGRLMGIISRNVELI